MSRLTARTLRLLGGALAVAGLGWTATPEASAVPTGPQPAMGGPALAPGVPFTPTADIAQLGHDIDFVLATGSYRRADWGVLVYSLDRRDTLYSRNVGVPMAPASNMKLVTSVAALHYLGADYRYRTWLLSDAPVVDGILKGDLVLYGTGDPGLGDRYYRDRAEPWRRMAEQLKAAGIHSIEGRVIGDGSYFSGPLRLIDDWEAEDLNEWFAAPSGALSYNENVASLRIEPGSAGSPPIIHSVPDHTGLGVRNEARTVAGTPSHSIAFLREDPNEPILVAGEIREGSPDAWRQMTIADPALFAAHGLTHTLRDEGLRVALDPVSIRRMVDSPLGAGRIWTQGSPWRVMAEIESPPLLDYLTAVNQRSHNLFADLMLKTLGRALEGQGSFAAGARVVDRFLTEELGVPEQDHHVLDGSGLAPANLLSARSLVAALEHAQGEPYWDALWESLPEAGGRNLRRMSQTAASSNLRAKTGTIAQVSALSGVVLSRDGERLAFSIIGNHLPSEQGAKRLEDRIGVLLAEWRRAATQQSP